MITKQRPREPLAYIHSKPVVYTNNGGGRDTYISDSSGGLRTIYQPAYQKRTFYNELRQYPKIDNYGRRGKSHTATFEERNDTFSRSQDHWNSGFRREMTLLGNYQRMLDHRLSKPKAVCKVPREHKEDKVYKNSAFDDQQMHQSIFKSFGSNRMPQNDVVGGIDKETYGHLSNLSALNVRRYN